MQCISDQNCPALQICINQQCQHSPIYNISVQTVFSFFLLPILMVVSNKIGMSTIWVSYPILIALMAYTYREAVQIIPPIAFAGGFIMLYLSLKQKSQDKYYLNNPSNNYNNYVNIPPNPSPTSPQTPTRPSNLTNSASIYTAENTTTVSHLAINFYIVNIAIPILVVGVNLGLIFAKLVPFLYIAIVGLVSVIVFIVLGIYWYRDRRAGEKIMDGHFRKMLPDRIKQNSPLKQKSKTSINIQLAQIQQSDHQIQQSQKSDKSSQMAPRDKKKVRQQTITEIQRNFPLHQFIIALLSFLFYQCLCLTLAPFFAWLGVETVSFRILISYGIIVGLLIIGEVLLYKFYVQPVKIREEFIKLKLGLGVLIADCHPQSKYTIIFNILKLSLITLFASILEGFIGLGFYYVIFFYLLYKENTIKDSIATLGFLNIFIATVYTLNSIFCGSFHVFVYIAVFFLTLGICGGCQYLFNSYLQRNMQASTIGSKMIVFIMIILGICLISISLSIYLIQHRYGQNAILGAGSVQNC